MKMHDKMFEPLDSYEEELMEALENHEVKSTPMGESELQKLQLAAKLTLEKLEVKKQISLKIRVSDLTLIKQKAQEVSIPYQNIIQALLHKYATGQIKLEI